MSLPNNRKLYIKTWGCQMNVYDSQRMADVLAPLGYAPTQEPAEADMIILNTCHIREKATDKVFSELGRLRPHKQAKEAQGEKLLMAVAGCVAQAEGDFILERAPYIDMVFGPQTYHELPEMVAKAIGAYGDARIVNTEFPQQSKFDLLPEERLPQGVSAFLSIQEGCDKFCTFCVVPYTRGAEYSRDVNGIVGEVRRLVGIGAREITLLGQNVNAFHGDGPDGKTWGLGRLIQKIAKIDGLERIRYTTSHPRDMDEELIETHAHPKLMPFLHLPVQSGSDAMLKAMNRKHTGSEYRRIIDRLRAVRSDIAFSSDFIVGFPGETDSDHEDTMRLVRDVGFASAYSFTYSARPGTPASIMKNLVHGKIADDRLQQLQTLVRQQQLSFNRASEGLVLPVLFDRKGKKPGQWIGKTPYNQSVYLSADDGLIGQTAHVKIDQGFENSLTGVLQIAEQAASL